MPVLRVVLVGTEGEINLGMIARLTENFGAEELYLVSPQADIESAKEYAVHAAHRLDTAKIVDTLEEALEDVSFSVCTTAVTTSGGDMLRVTTPLSSLSQRLENVEGTIAIVFGRESVGLTRDELAKCDVRTTIETDERYRTMNLACSAAVVLYIISRSIRGKTPDMPSRETLYKRKLALGYAEELSKMLFKDAQRREGVYLLFKKILSPGYLEDPEASLMLTFLSRTYSKLKRLEG